MKKLSVAKNNLGPVESILAAYSDCNEYGKGERNLDFYSNTPLTAETLKEVIPMAIPEGYNNFHPVESVNKLIEIFGDKSAYHVAREGSVCIYITSKDGNLWVNGNRNQLDTLNADEILFDGEKQQFRVWWD